MNPRKILLLRFSSIGDIIVTTPIIRCLKLQLNAEIHYATKKKFASILQGNIYIDKLHTFDLSPNEILESLQEENFDLIFDMHKNIRSHLLKWKINAPSITYDKLSVLKWMIVMLRIDRMPKNKHLVDRYFDSLAFLYIKNDGKGLDYFLSFENLPLVLPPQYSVLVLGAAHATKRIPISKCQEIIDIAPHNVILIGGEDVKNEGEDLQLYSPKVINLVGKLSLNQSAIVIQNSMLVITGDTGMMHLAAALKKQIVTLWGSTYPGFGMYPYYGNSELRNKNLLVQNLRCQPCSKIGKDICPKGHHACMERQDVSRIFPQNLI